MVEKVVPEPLKKKKKIKIEPISGSTMSSFMQFAFIICPILRLAKTY